VAAIYPAAPLDLTRIAASGRSAGLRVGMKVTETRVDIGFMTLASLLPVAFGVPPYQVAAPGWLNEQRFDIRATIPAGVTREQVPRMLQSLLTERFGMAFHRESRELPVYSLVVAKGGPKMQEASALTDNAGEAADVDPDNDDVRITRGASANGMTVSTNRGSMNVKLGDDGAMRLEAPRMTMTELARLLTGVAGRPVVDNTGLTGTYQVALELSMVDIASALKAGGPAPLFSGVPGPGVAAIDGASPAATATDPADSSAFEAVRKLGLRLESKHAPMDVVVIDRMEKQPTPN
jgi:uncharacterized protein (TIGR03435 family)